MGIYLTRLQEHEKITAKLTSGKRGNPDALCVSESGLYKLIMRSDKPEARKLR